MKVSVLMENVTPNDRLCARHGLSLHLESGETNILFDMGPDEAYLANAKTMGIDVSAVDFAVLSHGHFDHAGGLGAFLRSSNAPVFAQRQAFLEHAANTPVGMKDIGADATFENHPSMVLLDGDHEIAPTMRLISAVAPEKYFPASNCVLMEKGDEGFKPDAFAHEQSLLVNEGQRWFLVSGCSHTGIVNIIERAEGVIGGQLDAVVGGFHLMDPSSGSLEDPSVTKAVAEFMAARENTRYYTFHCTGLAAYGALRDVLGPRIEYLFAGSRVEV